MAQTRQEFKAAHRHARLLRGMESEPGHESNPLYKAVRRLFIDHPDDLIFLAANHGYPCRDLLSCPLRFRRRFLDAGCHSFVKRVQA